MTLADLALDVSLAGFALAILVVAVLAYAAFRKMDEPLLKVRIFQHSKNMERAFLAFILSFVVFVPIAFDTALSISLGPLVDVGLLDLHLALILYGFWQFYLIVRPSATILDKSRRAEK